MSGIFRAVTRSVLECLGDKPCHFILMFDNGYFSEFGTFSITDWVGHTPTALLAKNFGLPESTFASFPKGEVYFAKGALPPEPPATPDGGWKLPPLTHKYRLLANPPRVDNKGGRLWLVDSTKFPISTTLPERSWNSTRARCGNCIGTRRPTNGSTSSRARSA